MVGSPREPEFPDSPTRRPIPQSDRPREGGLESRLFGRRRLEHTEPGEEVARMQVRPADDASEASNPPEPAVQPSVQPLPVDAKRDGVARDGRQEPVPRELGERVQSGFQDLSRLLGAIKETLQGRDGQVQQTLQALPGFLQQVPRIHRAEIECLAQISKQLEHMGTGTRDVIARLDGLPDLLRTLTVGQAQQAQFLENLQGRLAESLELQGQALRQGLDQARQSGEAQVGMIRSLAATQEDIFSTFQNTQNRALNVFHRAQQQTNAQHRDTQKVLNSQVEMLVDRVHSAQSRVFWLSIGFAALAAAGMIAALLL